MPIVLKHQAAGIAPSPENPRLKYGMTMALQQQRADQEMRQRTQDAQYDMQRMGAMGQARMGATQEPSRAERREMLDMQIRNGAVPQGLIKPLRDLAGEEARIMRDRGLNARQMGEALSGIDSQMDIIMSSAYPQRMAANRMQQAQANQQPAGPPTARVAFRKDPKLREGYMARAQATFEGAEDRPTTEMILDKAGELFDAEQRWLNADPAAAAPQGQGQPAAQPPSAPTAAPAANPQASFSGGQPAFGAANVLANTAQPPQTPSAPQPAQQPPVVAPQSQQQPEKKKGKRGYISIAPGGGQSAGQPGGQASGGWKSKSTGVYSPDGKFLGDPSLYDEDGANYIRQQAAPTAAAQPPVATSGRDAAFNDYFNPENPEYARMRGADPNIMNPPKNVGNFKGRYGLGGMDYGINPATGNRVTASVRPGGGLEYDEPTGGPRGKGGVTVMGGKSKPAPATQQQGVVGVDVSPGGTDVKAGLNAAAPVQISRDDPRVKDALAVVNDRSATLEQQRAAGDILDSAGFTEDELKKIVQAAPPAAGSYRPSSGDMWGNPNKQPAAKKESTWGTQKDVLEIPGRLIDDISAQATATQRKLLGLPPLNDQEVADPSGELTETQRKNLRMKPKSKAEFEDSTTTAPPAEKAASLEMPDQPSFELVDTTERTPQAVMFLESMKKFADAKGPEVSKAVMSVYEKKLSDKEKAEVIRGLIKMGVDIVAQDKKTRAEVLRKMPPNKTPKYPLPKNRGKFPTKDTNPRMFET